jgi:diguanylate cyclase (GGDEF)-like protein
MYVQKAAETDIMTGLPNAAGFRTFVNRTRAAGTLTRYNAFYINLKSFGLINKRYGKHEADNIIVRFAELLHSYTDDSECAGRLSGDAFILMVHKEKTNSVLELTSGVNIRATVNGQEEMATLQAVAGCLDIDDNDIDSEGIIGRCSTALNVARYEKHVPYLFSTPEMHSKAIRQKQILSVFSEALENGEFRPYYQPKVDTETRTLAGAEALVRWVRDGAIITPGEFIPVLETGDSICVLDFCIFEQVCRDIRRWLDDGIEPVRISTNFSRRNLADPCFSDKIRNILAKYGIPKRYIEVEVTETISEEENDRLSKFIRDMHESEIAMAIDDFGTGYSSLNLLRNFSADVLKLDKSFIDGHTGTKRDSVVVSNVAKMASELDMSVITEGVEKWEQVEFLKSVHINMVQGFLFDKPLPKEAFEQRLKHKTYD